jgi:hypothetical protein
MRKDKQEFQEVEYKDVVLASIPKPEGIYGDISKIIKLKLYGKEICIMEASQHIQTKP